MSTQTALKRNAILRATLGSVMGGVIFYVLCDVFSPSWSLAHRAVDTTGLVLVSFAVTYLSRMRRTS